MKKTGFILILIAMLIVSSCSLLPTVASDGYDILKQYTTEKLLASDGQPIDSIVVKSAPVYWKEPKRLWDSTEVIEDETDFEKSGYDVWILETNQYRRIEVQRKDTTIYFYKKKQ